MTVKEAIDAEPLRPPVRLCGDRTAEMFELGFWTVFLMAAVTLALACVRPFAPGPMLLWGLTATAVAPFAAGSLWRIRDRRPAIEATPAGLACHPSLYPGTIPWSEITTVEVAGAKPARLRIHVRHRFWALSTWLEGASVRLSLPRYRLSRRSGQQMARDLNAWRKAAASSEASRP